MKQITKTRMAPATGVGMTESTAASFGENPSSTSRAPTVSLTRDMSGLCDTRSVRFLNRSKRGGEDGTDGAVARTEADEVRAAARALARRRVEPTGGGGDLGGDG